jgi:8-oxo-dGTP diphosphatase
MPQYTYSWPRPAVSADCVILGRQDERLHLLLIRRGSPPFEGQWALPGGFVNENEDLDQAALRELQEETGLRDVPLQQLGTWGKPGRDPRTRVITVAYLGLVRLDQQSPQAADDAAAAGWFSLGQLPELAFDHQDIVDFALNQLQLRIRCQPLGREWLPEEFSLADLQKCYQAVLGRKLSTEAFQSQILQSGLLRPVADQPGQYRFDNSAWQTGMKQGMTFDPDLVRMR